MMEKIDLKGLTQAELEAFALTAGEQKYRGKQLFDWLYQKEAGSFAEMSTFSRPLREKLDARARIGSLEVAGRQESRHDGTTKFLFQLDDGRRIESVLIPPRTAFRSRDALGEDEQQRLTLCVSTQVGCALDCKFCATATMGFQRNLTVGEIVGQVMQARTLSGRKITNLVYMGMGEPLLNYENVMKSVEIISVGLKITARRITVSTAGWAPRIRQMADEGRKVKLAISLHSLDEATRTALMPLNAKFSVQELLEASAYYYGKTKQRITFEYILFDGRNDRDEDVARLVKLSKSVPCKLNIIPFHNIGFTRPAGLAAELRPSPPRRAETFVRRLRDAHVTVFVRSSAGEELDAADLRVKRVTIDHKPLEFHTVEETLVVDLGKPYSLADTITATIAYAVATPKKGLYFTAPDSGYPDKQTQAWTQGEPDDNHRWFPCYDYPNDWATSEMIVTVPEQCTAISNGKLLEVKRDQARHTATFHWFEGKPHVSYLTSLVVGEYVEVKEAWEDVPLSYYVYKHQKEHALRSFGKTPKVMEFYSRKAGRRYPWEKYSQTVVQDFIWGGEENVSATTLADGTIHDGRAHLDFSSDNLVAHELAHQWWGDLLTCRDWSHAWLNEGFATFFQNQFTEYDRGHDEAAKETMDNQASLRNTDVGDRRRPTVCRRFFGPNDLFDNRIYGKGSVVLNMLKDLLGEELFWRAIDRYCNQFAFRNVETNDFKIAVEEATGYNLGWFFDQWLIKAGYPEFDLSTAWSSANRTLSLTVRQVQRVDSLTPLFAMPVDVELWVHGVPETHRIWVSRADEVFSFPAYQEPQLVLFDKGSKQMKKVTFQKPTDAWVFQLAHASEGVDRLLAIDELAWVVDSANVAAALRQAAIDDPFWDVRRGAVWALGDAKVASVETTLIAAYGDLDARVRAAAITSMGKLRTPTVLSTLQHAFEKDSSYGVAAAALRSLAQVDSVNAKAYCAQALQHGSRNEMIRSAAIKVLAHVGDDDALRTVLSYTRYGVDRNIRIECVNTLASTWKSRDEAVAHLIRMLGDPSFHVRRAVIGALGTTRDARALQPLQERLAIESDTRVLKDVRDAVEKIQQAQQSH